MQVVKSSAPRPHRRVRPPLSPCILFLSVFAKVASSRAQSLHDELRTLLCKTERMDAALHEGTAAPQSRRGYELIFVFLGGEGGIICCCAPFQHLLSQAFCFLLLSVLVIHTHQGLSEGEHHHQNIIIRENIIIGETSSVSLSPFVSRRGLSNTNQRLSQKQ